jgi:hypothetical protein
MTQRLVARQTDSSKPTIAMPSSVVVGPSPYITNVTQGEPTYSVDPEEIDDAEASRMR